jgi:hypothetical protein
MIFGKSYWTLNVCFVFLYKLVWNISHSNHLEIITIVHCLHVKCPLFLLDFNETWIFSTYYQKILRCQVSWKTSNGSHVVPCGHTDGQTNRQTHMMKQTIVFCKYAKNTPKNNLPNIWKMPLVMPISFFAMQWYAPKSEGPTFVMFNRIWDWKYKHILHIKSVTLLEVRRFFDCVCITVILSHGTKLSSDIWSNLVRFTLCNTRFKHNSAFCPHSLFLYFVRISQKIATFAVYDFNCLIL